VAVAYLGELVEPEKVNGIIGGWIAATVTGGLSGRVTSGVLAELFGWRAVFVVFALVTLSVAALLARVLPSDHARASGGMRDAYGGMLAHLRNRRLLGAFLIGGALFFGFIGVFTYLPYYLTTQPFNLAPGIVAFAYVSYAAGVITSPLAGRLSSRVPQRILIAIGLIVMALGMTLTLISRVPMIVLGLVILCGGTFTAQAVAPAFVNQIAREAKGSASALYLMAYYLGGTLGGVLPGLAWQSFGWIGVVLCCLGALVIALISNWLLCRE
jgi:MFS transporter, YNFM family, putative membrane transport protein